MSPTIRAYVLDPAERAASTFVQQFAVILLATGSAGLIHYQQWGAAADTAGFAALISIGTSLLTFPVPKLNAGADLVLRVLKTGGQSFVGVLVAAQVTSVVHANWKDALATAVPVALTALLKGLASLAAPWSEGASLLPTGSTDTGAADDDDWTAADTPPAGPVDPPAVDGNTAPTSTPAVNQPPPAAPTPPPAPPSAPAG
jgi:hypothetical protein